ncbi:hypothetical protein ACJJTC_007606 [Scirpophaga incertulas]
MCDPALALLCNFDERNLFPDNHYVEKLWSGDWSIDENLCKKLVMSNLNQSLFDIVRNGLNQEEDAKNILFLGIQSLLTFCDHNLNPNSSKLDLEQYLKFTWPEDIDVTQKLQRDSEPIFVNIVYPQLLYLSHEIFSALILWNQTWYTYGGVSEVKFCFKEH